MGRGREGKERKKREDRRKKAQSFNSRTTIDNTHQTKSTYSSISSSSSLSLDRQPPGCCGFVRCPAGVLNSYLIVESETAESESWSGVARPPRGGREGRGLKGKPLREGGREERVEPENFWFFLAERPRDVVTEEGTALRRRRRKQF